MRILYIVTAFPRFTGDVITPWLVETIERLRELSVEVEVLAPSYRGLGDHLHRGIRVHRFRYAPARLETLTHDQTTPDRIRERPAYLGLVPGYVAAGSAAAVRLTRGGAFDIVHSFWPLPHGVLGLAAGRFAHIPHVATFFGVELTWLRRQLPLLSPLVRSIVRRSDAVTVISTHTERELLGLVPEARVQTIPFGAAIDPSRRVAVDVQGAAVAPSRPEFGDIDAARREDADVSGGAAVARAEHRGDEESFRLLFVGRLVERKGIGVLLRAVAELRAEGRPVHLTVVGDGPLRADLEGLARELGIAAVVTFAGFVGDEELSGQYEACDAFVLPAVEDSKGDVEGLGVVLIEALLHSRPVIASATGGIPDIVRDGETGLLTVPGDPGSLADAVRRLMDTEDGAALARAGRADVEQRFSWPVIVGALAELYREVLATRRESGARPSAAEAR